MEDRHLNLFYSYNQSREAELIENNLTRAFIQALRMQGAPPRDRRRGRIQTYVRRVLKRGDYEWQTVRLEQNGRVVT
ncbi:MAG: hypothetical protein ABIL25_00740 [candidate division WOR-3 bacterium]